jgi:hypothetical protein
MFGAIMTLKEFNTELQDLITNARGEGIPFDDIYESLVEVADFNRTLDQEEREDEVV